MALSHEDLLHGATITNLLREIAKLDEDIVYKIKFDGTKAAYQIIFSHETRKGLLKIGFFLKHSRKRISPWRYTFTNDHQEEIETLDKENDYVFVLLITDQEGVAVLNSQLLKSLLDNNSYETGSISISRKHGENYRVNGSKVRLNKALPKNNFPSSIADVVIAYLKRKQSKRKLLLKYFKYLVERD